MQKRRGTICSCERGDGDWVRQYELGLDLDGDCDCDSQYELGLDQDLDGDCDR